MWREFPSKSLLTWAIESLLPLYKENKLVNNVHLPLNVLTFDFWLTGDTAPLCGCIEVDSGEVLARRGDTVMPRCLLLISRLSSCVASPPRPGERIKKKYWLCTSTKSYLNFPDTATPLSSEKSGNNNWLVDNFLVQARVTKKLLYPINDVHKSHLLSFTRSLKTRELTTANIFHFETDFEICKKIY